MFERINKMDRRTLAALAIAGVVGILLFSAIAGGIRQAGWNEGFLVGVVSSGSEPSQATGIATGTSVNPYLATRGGGIHGWGWHPFWIIGGFFRFLFFGFLVMIFLKFVFRHRWGCHHGSHHRYGTGHGASQYQGWRHHGPQQWGEQHTQQQTQSTGAMNVDPMPGADDQPMQNAWTKV